MALIFMDGMYYPTADLPLKYSELKRSVGISSETARDNTPLESPGSIFLENDTGDTPTVDYSPPYDLEGTTIGLRFKNTGPVEPSHRIWLRGSIINLNFNSNYSITVSYPGGSFTTDPAVYINDVWSYLELQYTKGTGSATVTLRINEAIPTTGGGSGFATASGLTITANTSRISFLASAGGGAERIYFQDFYVLDGLVAATGPANNDFLGDVRVDIQRPDSPGAYTEFTPSAGANWENVDEYAMDGDTTYNKSDLVGAKDTYNLAAIVATGADIFGVQQHSVFRKDDASIRYVKQLLKSGAVEDLGVEIQLSDTYLGRQRPFDADPNTNIAWTETGLNALESGVTVSL